MSKNAELRQSVTDAIDFENLTNEELQNILDYVKAGCFSVASTNEELNI